MIIISLTTHGKRLERVHLTLKTLLSQIVKADRVVLWIPEAMRDVPLPEELQRLQPAVEVRYTEDIGPATKLIPALRAFPADTIVTADDDVLYSRWWLAWLRWTHRRHPNNIICTRVHKIKLGADGYPITYKKWGWDRRWVSMHPLLHPTGVGGVLYPPGSLHPDVFDIDAMRRLTPMSDDVWFKIQSLRNGWFPRRIGWPRQLYWLNENASIEPLCYDNNDKQNAEGWCRVDLQLRAVLDYYGLDLRKFDECQV